MTAQTDSFAPNPSDWLACLTYKSVATAAPSNHDLDQMVAKARARNRSLQVTGMLLFENGRFLQTLEGPAKSMRALWSSIQRDNRHDHIEVLSEHIASARLFTNWDLLVDGRFDHLAPVRVAASSAPAAVEAHIARLVDLALNADDLGLNAAIAEFGEQGWTADAIVTLLIEPAARALGDAWLEDACTEIDLTIGLSMLQLAGHTARQNHSMHTIRASRYRILLATAPGEQHMLGTSLLADQFFDHGWHVDMAFPDSDEALANQIEAERPDAVDIGLSDACPRRHALANLRATVQHSRLLGAAHPTVVSVGGRLFAEAAATAMSVGADHARKGLAGTSIRIAELVKRNRTS
ncbi:MAG: BLUF domain-containing protein [Sphingomonas sp.]|nr:BLUF domain-containing protein [Sphingomonas sp.]